MTEPKDVDPDDTLDPTQLPNEDSDTKVPERPLTTDPKLQAILDTITGDTPQAVDYAYKAAFEKCCPKGKIVPPRDVMAILAEQHRRAHERFVMSRARKTGSSREKKEKSEFTPAVQEVLDWLEAHFAEHGAAEGLRVKDIAAGMGKSHSGTVWHSVRALVEARRVRPMPDDAKRFTFFPSAEPVEAVTPA